MKLVEVKGWYRNPCNYSLLYSVKKRRFIKGIAKGKDIIYKLRPDKYIRFEYECNLSEKVPNIITLKLISIKNDATEEVIASSTIKYCLNTFLRRLEIPQVEDFDRMPYRILGEAFNKIYGEEDKERLLLFVIANVNIDENEVKKEEIRRWEEEVRRGYAPILKYKDELEELYRLYKGLPTAYVCPFCGYASYEQFHNCPKCKAMVKEVEAIKVMTKEYKQLLNDVRAKMELRMYEDGCGRLICEGDGFTIYEGSYGKMVCKTETGWDEPPEFLPKDVGLPVWATCYLVTGRIKMMDEDAVEAQKRHEGS
jgi:hypothetical protein